MSEARLSTAILARAVLETTGKSVFVDTARDHQRPRYLAGGAIRDLKAIHLVRDPRGNAASIMKHTGVSVSKAARQWRHYNLEADRARTALPPDSWMLLHYEELCADPQSTLDRISGFLGVDPAPIVTNSSGNGHHIIGNSMRLRGISEIREDRSWKKTLDRADLRVVADITGRASHKLGYDWP
jgi:hypothetical protein